MRAAALLLCLIPAACGPGMPDLDHRLTAQSQASGFPELVPIGPLLAQADADAPRVAATEGLSLEARAADLRRRANWLRSLQL
ncbi:hypothetical protein [Gymnodinialimonas hymeniacidonis]|uniref:hypothetical protein n=1 Tax=Gymnodinialimonas hymeniacidonis TaxID=3126508 RepID=UPI0034C63F4B